MKITVSSVFLLIFLIVITAMCLLMVYFVLRTTYYVNYLTDCDPNSKFCYIKKLKLSIPNHLLNPLEQIAQTEGIRVEIYKKRQKAVSIQKLQAQLPEIVEWYKTLTPQISAVIGEQVKLTPFNQPNSLSLVIHKKVFLVYFIKMKII